MNRVRLALDESVRVKRDLVAASAEEIAGAGEYLAEIFRRGGKVLLFGNGGSAADAQHLADEWVNRFRRDRPGLPALALTANASDLTAIANDQGFEHVFARQIEAHGRAGDAVIAISTSGDSPNVLAAVEVARELGIFTVALTGRKGGSLAERVDCAIRVPSDDTARIQESHIAVGHIWCELVDAALFPEPPSA